VKSPLSVPKRVFWHRDLPPVNAELAGEGIIEASSVRVADTLAERSALWQCCLTDLKHEAHRRLEQERLRLKAGYVHVLSEETCTRRDPRTGEAWLQGTFGYVLLSAPRPRVSARFATPAP